MSDIGITDPNAPEVPVVEVAPVVVPVVDTADLGVIIPTVKGRKIAYAIYAGASLLVTNTAVGFSALNAQFPAWLTVCLAVIGNLASAFGALAIANASNKK